jgi:hypothetical protein
VNRKKRAILVLTYHIVKLGEGVMDGNDRNDGTSTDLYFRMTSDQVMRGLILASYCLQ